MSIVRVVESIGKGVEVVEFIEAQCDVTEIWLSTVNWQTATAFGYDLFPPRTHGMRAIYCVVFG